MPLIDAKIANLNIIIGNFRRSSEFIMKAIGEVIQETGEVFAKDIRDNISQTDHSLKDLKDLGHPYARRHGEKGSPIHSPFWLVHRQSGDLLDAFYKEFIEDTGHYRFAFVCGVNTSIAPHAIFVHEGTENMIPRPFLKLTLEANREKYQRMILKGMGRRKTWAQIGFAMGKGK